MNTLGFKIKTLKDITCVALVFCFRMEKFKSDGP
jgi:hypothetical protein